MEGNNLVGQMTEWPPATNADLKAIFDSISSEFGPPDVDFRAESRIFKVHKKVLEKHSSVLKAQLSDVWRTSGDVLQLDEEYVEPEVVEELLTWMYYTNDGNDRKCSAENAHSLCIAADYLMISKLVDSCCRKLSSQIRPNNFYEIYTFSKNLHLDDLRQNCESCVSKKSSIYFLSPQVVKWTTKELKMFIKKSLKVEKRLKVHETILFSLPIWIDSSEERFRELENLLKFVQPETLSSDALLRFMETELYSKLDESIRKQYFIRPYLSEGSSSTDKLYCIRESNGKAYCIENHLDLSANPNWSDYRSELTIPMNPKLNRILGVASGKKIYYLRDTLSENQAQRCRMDITVCCTETGESRSISTVENTLLDDHNRLMLAGAVLYDYIYVTYNRSVNRFFCLRTAWHRWEACEDMQTTRFKHQLVALDGQLYALGGEPRELDPRPERYNPRVNQWEYITPSNYHHRSPTAVAHKGQLYVFSQAGFEVFSPETDRWTQLPVPNSRLKPSLVSIAERLWLMSDSRESRKFRRVYEFDVVDRKWTRLPDMPKGKFKNFAFVIKQ